MVRRSRRNASERFNGDPDRRSRQASHPTLKRLEPDAQASRTRRSSVGLKKQSQLKLAGRTPASFSWLCFFSPRIYPGERETRNAKRETRNAKRGTREARDRGTTNAKRKRPSLEYESRNLTSCSTPDNSNGAPSGRIRCVAPASTNASRFPISPALRLTVRSIAAGSRPTSRHQSSRTPFLRL